MQKPLGEMSSTEVIAALKWHDDIARSLNRVVKVDDPTINDLVALAATRELMPDERELCEVWSLLLQDVHDIEGKALRLLEALIECLPNFEDMPLAEAVRRYWGRAA